MKKKSKPTGGPTENGWHQAEAFLRCPQEFKLASLIGAHKPSINTPSPLARGGLVHEGRGWWYSHGFPTDAKSYKKMTDHMRDCSEQLPLPVRNKDLIEAISYVTQYCDHWSTRTKPQVVAVEHKLGPVGFKPDSPWWHYRTAKVDDVSHYAEALGKLCIGELKTTSVGVDDAENQYTLHGQLLLQFMLWRMADQGERTHGPISHVMLDVIKKGYGGDKCVFARVPIPVTEHSLRWFASSMEWYLNAMARVTIDKPAPHNPQMCTRLIGRARVPCEFRELCKYGRSVAGQYVDKDGVSLTNPKYVLMETQPWD